MPGNLKNSLYPPQISTFLPAFVNTTDAVIYFSLSPFNTSSEIQRVHITLQNQLNNENALKNSSGILVSPLRYDTVSGLYYAVIPVTEVQGGVFNINQFYKVQIRFDNNTVGVPAGNDQLLWTNYFLQYQTNFSEWSSVCLIRPILQPSIELRTFDTENGDISFNKGIIPISGQVFFGDSFDDTETLQSYNIEIIAKDSEKTVYTTQEIYTGDNLNPNDINYKLDLQTLDTSYNTEFKMKINITTKNQYKMSKIYEFKIADFLDEATFNPEITVTMDNEDGIAVLHIENTQTVFGTLYVKRASSLNNFKEYESIWTDKVAGPIDLTIEDNTVGSLVWYRYSVQLENSRGAFTQVYRSQKFLPDFYDAIFSRNKQQLRLQYNYSVSSYKPVVNRSKIDTLGGRYPKFVENAILNYKQFSISGSISATNDVNQKFLEQREYFGEEYNNFLIYNQEDESHMGYRSDTNNIYLTKEAYDRNDFFWEREFRETALAWLNDGEPKLYRSMAEGSMVVMLTDVSLTPNKTTGRRMWDFTATAYEIANADSLNTLDSLGVYNTHKIPESARGGGGSFDPEPEYVEVIKIGQLYQYQVTTRGDIISEVIRANVQEKYGGVLNDKHPDDFYLKNVKIYFHNKPNAYLFDSLGNPQLIANPGATSANGKPLYDINQIQLGYVFEVSTSASEGTTPIFVNEKGYYQLPDYLDIDRLHFLNIGENKLDNSGNIIYTIEPDIVTLEYTLVYKEKNNMSTIISGTSIDRTVLGQEQGTYDSGEYLGDMIKNKYNFIQPDISNGDDIVEGYVQKMQFWKGLFIETSPYSVVHIKYKGETDYKDYLIGETGVLYMLKDVQVEDMCFLGKRMTKVSPERQKYLEKWEYVKISQEYNSLEDISNPALNTVYNIQGSLKIYYQFQWYDFIEDNTKVGVGLAKVPTDAMINYVGDILRSTS